MTALLIPCYNYYYNYNCYINVLLLFLLEEETWDEWERESQYDSDPKCLFCSDVFDLPEDAFHHCKEIHGFDFLAVKRSLGKYIIFSFIGRNQKGQQQLT